MAIFHSRLTNLARVAREFKICGRGNLNIVSKTADGVNFVCLFGLYKETTGEELIFSYEKAAEHFGITLSESTCLFRPANGGLTISQRQMLINTLIKRHKEQTNPQRMTGN